MKRGDRCIVELPGNPTHGVLVRLVRQSAKTGRWTVRQIDGRWPDQEASFLPSELKPLLPPLRPGHSHSNEIRCCEPCPAFGRRTP